ncbi:MAG: hypothetical protein KJ060_03175 [Candidatus Hydrogenedentes bacterium]|nr:hypothetical protein [Candidatus Hydrogenedentota bacterium]
MTDKAERDSDARQATVFVRVLDKVASILATLAAAVAIGYLLWFAAGIVGSGITEIRGEEPLVISGVMKILLGLPLYTDPEQPPFDLVQYTPLYHYLLAGGSWFAGIEPGQAKAITSSARLLSVSISTIHLVILFLILRYAFQVRGVSAFVAAAAIWTMHAPWEFMARGDGLASLCFTLAIGIAFYALRRRHVGVRIYLFIAFASFLGYVAFMAKQNGAQICVVLLTYFLLQREWRCSVVVIAAAVIPLALTVWFSPLLVGEHFLDHVVGGLNNGIRIRGALEKAYLPVFLDLNMAALTAVGAYLTCLWWPAKSDPYRRFIAVALAVTFTLASLSSLKLGAASHYYNDYISVLIFAIAFWLGPIVRERVEYERPIRWAIAVFAVLFFGCFLYSFRNQYEKRDWTHFSNYERVVVRLKKDLTSRPDVSFFTIDPTLANHFPGRAVIPQYPLSAIMHARGVVDYREAEAMMQNGAVRWLFLGDGQNPERQLGFVGIEPGAYTRQDELDGFSIWVSAAQE